VCRYPRDAATGTTGVSNSAGPASTTGTTGCLTGCTTSAGPSSTTGTTGVGTSAGNGSTSSTTGGCACTSNSDCNDAFHMGYVCDGNLCRMGPDGAAASSTGGACANPTSSSTTGGGTTGSAVCTCTQDSQCNDAFHQGYVCDSNVCRIGPNAAAASSTGGACAQGGNTSTTTSGGSTPLVLSFDRAPVQFTQAPGAFELSGKGTSVETDWVAAATPWLALDRNGNGTIDDGSELFGSMTRMGKGTARNGFEALAQLDSNHDGRLDARDPAFARLLLWRDLNQDRRAQPGELTPLARSGVIAIELSYASSAACDARGNCARERASLIFKDAQGQVQRGQVIDVWLHNRPTTLGVR
jgi:hypothetical protein